MVEKPEGGASRRSDPHPRKDENPSYCPRLHEREVGKEGLSKVACREAEDIVKRTKLIRVDAKTKNTRGVILVSKTKK